MSEQFDDLEPTSGRDVQLEHALVEYANSMEDDVRNTFLDQLKTDPAYFALMAAALSDMAMLLAGAAVMETEAEFNKLRRTILSRSRKDDVHVMSLRRYYLYNRHAVDLGALLVSDTEREKVFEERLASLTEDYNQLHPL